MYHGVLNATVYVAINRAERRYNYTAIYGST